MPDYTVLLSAGPTYPMTQNQIYALPASRCTVLATNVCEVSPTTTTTQFAAVTATTTGVECFGGFIRCTGSTTASIIVKKL